MAWMETYYQKHTHFRWNIKWRLEHLGPIVTMAIIEIQCVKSTCDRMLYFIGGSQGGSTVLCIRITK